VAKVHKRLVVVLVVSAFLVTGVVALESFLDPFDDQPFDSAAWMANGTGNR
jgi:hypothetical protein